MFGNQFSQNMPKNFLEKIYMFYKRHKRRFKYMEKYSMYVYGSTYISFQIFKFNDILIQGEIYF